MLSLHGGLHDHITLQSHGEAMDDKYVIINQRKSSAAPQS